MRPARSLGAAWAVAAALLSGAGGAAACREGSASSMAGRILERYRKTSGAKPLPAGGMVRLRLSRPGRDSAVSGLAEIVWEPRRYRESASSAGATTARGIEGGKAYFTDADGVTRVVSDPVLRELTARSYFWRRAWLFRDREGARVGLGPADDATVSVTLRPEGGNPIRLAFSRGDGSLLAVDSPRFRMRFSSPRAFSDLSDPPRPIAGEIVWAGLPTGRIPQPVAGGGSARFAAPSVAAPMLEASGAVAIAARLSGEPIRLAIDAAADGPLRVSRSVAARLPLRFSPDVFGRDIAAPARLDVAGLSYPGIFVQRSEEIPPGADAVAGGAFFRETIVEIDPEGATVRFHDPSRWAPPEGYVRVVIDDDQDRPVAILSRGSHDLRLAAGSDLGAAALSLAAESAERAGLRGTRRASGLTWGTVALPPLPLRTESGGYFPDWGDDGRLGDALLLRFHSFIDMPRRWIYLRPTSTRSP